MLIVETVQVFPPSDVVKPEESASVRTSVSINEESAASKMIFVDKYS
jgi:hypothetical protein